MKIDWLEGTILGMSVESALEHLKTLFPHWQELTHGGLGYECSAVVYETGRVYWSKARPDNGVHFSLPPSAIELSGLDYATYAKALNIRDTKFTRLDLAADDTLAEILNLETICEAVEAGHFVSIAKKKPLQIIDYESGGRTFYFGRGQSQTIIRLYDKAAEQRAQRKRFLGHWVRAEMQLRKERANAAVKYILEHPDDWQPQACSWLLAALDFKIPGPDSTKSRWQTAEWWTTFLEVTSKERLFISRRVRTIDDVARWLESQAAIGMLIIQTVQGKTALSDMANHAAGRLKPKHIQMINAARGIENEEEENAPSDVP